LSPNTLWLWHPWHGFLAAGGVEISLTSRALDIDHHTFPFVDREGKLPTDPCLASGGGEGPELPAHSEVADESVEDWVGTVELAGNYRYLRFLPE